MTPLIIYHNPCTDGFASAYILKKKLGEAELFPARYSQPPPLDLINNRDTYLVDYTYRDIPEKSVKDLSKVLEACKSITIIDHHKSVQEDLWKLKHNKVREIVFSLDNSGAILTWGFTFPDTKPPVVMKYVEDKDLWVWKLNNSRYINAAIDSYPKTIEAWDVLTDFPATNNLNEWKKILNYGATAYSDTKLVNLLRDGIAIERFKERLVEEVLENKMVGKIGDYEVEIANTSVLYSEIAGILAKNKRLGATYFQRADGFLQFSLRSDSNGVDVSEIAKKFGGGGHVHSAGFEFPANFSNPTTK